MFNMALRVESNKQDVSYFTILSYKLKAKNEKP